MLLLLLLASAASGGGQDPPEYVQHLEQLMNYSAKQQLQQFKALWTFPEEVFNPALVIAPGEANNDLALSIYNMGYQCKSDCGTSFMFLKIPITADGNLRHDETRWEPVSPSRQVLLEENNKMEAGKVGDPRLISFMGKLYAIGWQSPSKNYQETHVYEVLANVKKNMVVLRHLHRISFAHEAGGASQKNWSPFIYTYEHRGDDEQIQNISRMLFIQSALPHHRIVHANETDASDTSSVATVRAHTVALTELSAEDPSTAWTRTYGPVHGGTNAVLVQTEYGKRYLTFFHSQSHFMISWCLTYFMGAYLFEAEPPFAITHMTLDPVVPAVLYDEHTEGWSFKAIDYIVFPVSLLLLGEDRLLVSLGHNDKSGWVMEASVSGLVRQMSAVGPASTVVDRWRQHEENLGTHAPP